MQGLTDIINPLDGRGKSYIKDMYRFKELLKEVDIEEGDIIGSLDVVGMFPNVPVKKALEVVKEELINDESLRLRTDWKPQDVSKLLEISVETYFKTLDGKVYFQRNGLPIGKSISKPMAGIYMHWFEKTYLLNEGSKFKDNSLLEKTDG